MWQGDVSAKGAVFEPAAAETPICAWAREIHDTEKGVGRQGQTIHTIRNHSCFYLTFFWRTILSGYGSSLFTASYGVIVWSLRTPYLLRFHSLGWIKVGHLPHSGQSYIIIKNRNVCLTSKAELSFGWQIVDLITKIFLHIL